MTDLRPEISLDPAELGRARASVADMARRLQLDEQLEPYRTLRWNGAVRRAPTLFIDDFSEIPFLDEITAVAEYVHRARTRAGDGDLFVTVSQPAPGYEDYCRDLGMGAPRGIVTQPVGGTLGLSRGCLEGPAYEAIASAAASSGSLAVHPYMSIAPVWELAQKIADDKRVPVSVIGPPPPVTWIANDKMLLAEVVTRVLGEAWVVETLTSAEPAGLAEHLLALARRHARVGLKRLRCASAMGNAVFDSSALLAQDRAEVEQDVSRFLGRTQWDGSEQVQAVAWEDTDLSPSTQLWIPPLPDPPQLEGIYVQILEGPEKVFVGSRPSTLPAGANQSLGKAALQVAAALQQLGYVGRCSFDHLILGDPAASFRAVFTECNGRWGGTSLPMQLVDRLVPGPRPPYRAQDFVHPDLVGMSFQELLRRIGSSELYHPATGRGRFVFYNVNCLQPVGKIDVIALGRTQEEAEAAMTERLPAKLGL